MTADNTIETLSVVPCTISNTYHYRCRMITPEPASGVIQTFEALSSRDLPPLIIERSLSKALNSGLKQLSGDICLIIDQDVRLYPDAKEIILAQHQQYKDYDIILFRFNSPNNIHIPHCHYPNENKPHEQMLFLHFYEISFKNSLLKKRISFDEDFGDGTLFPFGESYTFIQRALKAGLRVHFSSRYIGQHPEGYLYQPADEINRLRSLGAINCKIHGWNYVLNYLNVSIRRMEKREALHGDGLAQLNKLNAYLLGAKTFKDKGKA